MTTTKTDHRSLVALKLPTASFGWRYRQEAKTGDVERPSSAPASARFKNP
jgi:hypothetical protein